MRIGRIQMAAAAALSLAAACAGAPQLMHSRPDTDGALQALQAEGFTETPTGDSLPVDRETARDLAEARQRLQAAAPAPVVAASAAPTGAPVSLQPPADNGFRCKRVKAPDRSATYYCTKAGDAVRVSADSRSGTASLTRQARRYRRHAHRAGLPANPAAYVSGAPFDEAMRAQARKSFSLYFDVASARVTPEAYDVLHDAAASVQSGSYRLIRIEGHTDLRGKERFNLALSLKRAKSSDKGLIDVLEGKAPPRSLQGYGASRPAVAGRDGLNSIKNRRVDIILF